MMDTPFYLNKILTGDARELAKQLPDQSVNCIVTSPPYWGLRDYGTAKWEGGDPECKHNPQRPDGGDRADRALPLGRGGMYRDECGKCGATRIDNQLGLERTPEEYVCRLVELFRELRRALKDDGTLWLNLGDSYAGSNSDRNSAINPNSISFKAGHTRGGVQSTIKKNVEGLKQKDLVGIPWRVAFALQADGWYLRSDIIWHKPNPMPESVTDRPTKSHEYIFLLSKSAKYYYDSEAVREKSTTGITLTAEEYEIQKKKTAGWTGPDATGKMARKPLCGSNGFNNPLGRNRRSVWTGKEGRLRLRRDLTPEQVSLVLRRIADGDFLLSSDTDSSSIEHEGDPQ